MWDRLRYLKYLAKAGIPAIVALNSYDTGADKVLSSMSAFPISGEFGILLANLPRRMGLFHYRGRPRILLEFSTDAIRLRTGGIAIIAPPTHVH